MKHDKAFVPVLGAEALAAASLHVRTLRSDALTLFFYHTIDAAPSALQKDARVDNHDPVVLADGRVHALYAVHLLLRALAHGPLQDMALQRILELLGNFLPRPLSYEARLAEDVGDQMALWVENNKASPDADKWQDLLPAMKRVKELIAQF